METREVNYEDIGRLRSSKRATVLLTVKMPDHPDIGITVGWDNYTKVTKYLKKAIDLFIRSSIDLLFLIRDRKQPRINRHEAEGVTELIFWKDRISVDSDYLASQPVNKLCFIIAKTVIDHEDSQRFLARTYKDLTYDEKSNSTIKNITTVVPHQGDLSYVKKCLTFLNRAEPCYHEVQVYFDEEVDKEHYDLIKAFSQYRFRSIKPCNSGPYVARNHCAIKAKTDYLLFQDSDDLPTIERYQVIYKAIQKLSDIDMIGTHELRVDEINEVIVPVRFPFNVNKSLKRGPQHVLLHPTAIIKKQAFEKSGYFSAVRRFGSDMQFLLRSHFLISSRNIDKFLYVRRKRRGSLTTAEETHLGSDIRKELERQWREDFEEVALKKKSVENSSLKYEPIEKEIQFEQLNFSKKNL